MKGKILSRPKLVWYVPCMFKIDIIPILVVTNVIKNRNNDVERNINKSSNLLM